MNLSRIATRVAKLRFADAPPTVDFGTGATFLVHILDSTVRDSNLPVEMQRPFLSFLRAKESFHAVFMQAFGRLDSAAIKRVQFAKSGLLAETKNLMAACKPWLDEWNPKFDTAYEQLAGWEFPDDPEEVWNIDVWASDVHELASAIFWALNGPDENEDLGEFPVVDLEDYKILGR
jgi:hypothetical protein